MANGKLNSNLSSMTVSNYVATIRWYEAREKIYMEHFEQRYKIKWSEYMNYIQKNAIQNLWETGIKAAKDAINEWRQKTPVKEWGDATMMYEDFSKMYHTMSEKSDLKKYNKVKELHAKYVAEEYRIASNAALEEMSNSLPEGAQDYFQELSQSLKRSANSGINEWTNEAYNNASIFGDKGKLDAQIGNTYEAFMDYYFRNPINTALADVQEKLVGTAINAIHTGSIKGGAAYRTNKSSSVVNDIVDVGYNMTVESGQDGKAFHVKSFKEGKSTVVPLELTYDMGMLSSQNSQDIAQQEAIQLLKNFINDDSKVSDIYGNVGGYNLKTWSGNNVDGKRLVTSAKFSRELINEVNNVMKDRPLTIDELVLYCLYFYSERLFNIMGIATIGMIDGKKIVTVSQFLDSYYLYSNLMIRTREENKTKEVNIMKSSGDEKIWGHSYYDSNQTDVKIKSLEALQKTHGNIIQRSHILNKDSIEPSFNSQPTGHIYNLITGQIGGKSFNVKMDIPVKK